MNELYFFLSWIMFCENNWVKYRLWGNNFALECSEWNFWAFTSFIRIWYWNIYFGNINIASSFGIYVMQKNGKNVILIWHLSIAFRWFLTTRKRWKNISIFFFFHQCVTHITYMRLATFEQTHSALSTIMRIKFISIFFAIICKRLWANRC